MTDLDCINSSIATLTDSATSLYQAILSTTDPVDRAALNNHYLVILDTVDDLCRRKAEILTQGFKAATDKLKKAANDIAGKQQDIENAIQTANNVSTILSIVDDIVKLAAAFL